MAERNILVTGAFGLVGSDLVPALQKKFGKDHVFALGNKTIPSDFKENLVKGDVRDKTSLEKIIKNGKITDVYHLAGLLSVGGEKDPDLAWDVNINGLRNVLELAREFKFKVFWPSSIAAFGPTTPKIKTPQHTSIEPTTMNCFVSITGNAGGLTHEV
jgi:nucleoside-diphosphate-sugar epimerase